MPAKHKAGHEAAELRARAEAKLKAEPAVLKQGDTHRLLHELQVHQVQLEMQNSELREARNRGEALLEKYTDLYDFAPVGYFSLDASARIQEVNLTGASMLCVERSRLLRRRFTGFVAPASRSHFESFLQNAFSSTEKNVCELLLESGSSRTIWVDLQGERNAHPDAEQPLCRLAVSDITALKRAAEAQRRVEELKLLNEALEAEVAARKKTEKSLRESKRRQSRLLVEARQMQDKLRMLSHKLLHVQEDERRRISVDLHDEIAQTLVAINVHLASLSRSTPRGNNEIREKIVETQQLVQHSVESVHRFAMGLRPTVLDDLGLVAALQACASEFTDQTQVKVRFSKTGELCPLGDASTVALYRVAQAALSNVAQHAQATSVQLKLRQLKRTVRLEIIDDGKAFNTKKERAGKRSNRLGLIGMQERIEMVGGKFTVSSSPGKGTTIRVSLPCDEAEPFNAPENSP